MFYDFLSDGFIDFAMEFYEDPINFDAEEAKARKAKEEAGDDLENQAVPDADEEKGLLSETKKKFTMSDIKIPDKELDDRIEESFSKNPLLQGKNKDVLKL